jgi:hypothetical protein
MQLLLIVTFTKNKLFQLISLKGYPFHVRWVLFHHGMARPQVADGGKA